MAKKSKIKSSLDDLNEIISKDFKLKHIAEKLYCMDSFEMIENVRQEMDNRNFDAIGVCENGQICGYFEKSELTENKRPLGDYKKNIESVLCDNIPLNEALEKLQHDERIFVKDDKGTYSIITRGDLQKLPIRMWLFALISLLEMHLTYIIINQYPKDSWNDYLKDKKGKNYIELEQARKLFEKRKKSNTELNLIDCLSLFGKYRVLYRAKKTEKLLKVKGKEFNNNMRVFNKLRNNLAHSYDDIFHVGTKRLETKKLADLIKWAKKIIKTSECFIKAN